MISFNLLPNMTLEERSLPRLQGIALWLIHVEEIFLYENFVSSVGTYLYRERLVTPSAKPSSFDQIAFYATANTQYEISHLFGDLTENLKQLIIMSVQEGILVNKMFAVVAAVITLIGGFFLGYFILKIHKLRFEILAFFERIEQAKIASQMRSAESFLVYLEKGRVKAESE